MCAIAGLVHKTGEPVSGQEIGVVTDLAAHRGPDGRGIFLEGNLGLGHRRLAIIHLSDDGLQPMHDVEDHLTLVFNGEIYNFIELRSELERLGYIFRTQSDSEVILAAYTEWQDDCVRHFNGMWAFAIYDRRHRKIFLSRDRFGVKPLYFVNNGKSFVFGSEIRQLLAYLPERRTDSDLVRTFLLTGALDLSTDCFFNGVEKLPAGANATFNLTTNVMTISSYYRLDRNDAYRNISAEDAVALYAQTIHDSVKLRLRADVEVGTCLSGGLDSSSVATIASELYREASGRHFSAITAISEDGLTDETPYAAKIVENSGLNWLRVRPQYKDFADSLGEIILSQQEPFASPSLTMQYFVMKTARENGIKVLLDGQAGDETLLGYDKYYYAYLSDLRKTEGWAGVVSGLQALMRANKAMGAARILKYTVGARVAPLRYFAHRKAQPALRQSWRIPDHLKAFSSALTDPFRLQELEIRSTNLPVLLRYEDRNSMAQGVEARLPFMDYRLVELSVNLPLRHKMKDGWTKWVLRKAMSKRMPDAITWRRNKFSFNAPDRLWLDAHHQEMKKMVLGSTLIQSVTQSDTLRNSFDRLELGSRWRLYSVALWQETFGISA